jgi:Domain of unknown function (DUF4470)
MTTIHPVYVSPMQWFCPMGNTPAVCLTQGLSPRTSAKALLLGNGDARNILYTLFYDDTDGARGSPRVYDFTCVDVEPAVLGTTH